jgi:DNA polymerase
MFNVPISAITKGSALRDKSKISELALGFGGSLGALRRMGGERMGLADAEMMSLVRKWRSANPCIVEMWDELDRAAKAVVMYGEPITCTDRNIVFEYDGTFMTIQLPSGRKLFYYKPRVDLKTNSLIYQGVVQETKQWGDIPTYGGKLAENIVQATARDLLGNRMLALYENGFLPVCHIHDEVLVEVPEANAKEQYEKMVDIMSISPEWAKDLPLRADGYITKFYLKD